MARGVVIRLVGDRGFGFIRTENGQEVFFLTSALARGELIALREGQAVEFVQEAGSESGRPRATWVRRLAE
jgi:cold shock CspA family protein